MALERELATYHKNLETLKENTGKYVLIHGEEVVDFYAAYEDAIKAGYRIYGLEPFLVKQVNATEAIQFISRRVTPIAVAQAA